MNDKMRAPGIGAQDTQRVSMPSLWRTKLLMAQKDRVNEGLQVSCGFVVGGPRHGWGVTGPRKCSNIWVVHDKQRHIVKQHKNEMEEGVFVWFFNATGDINRFFFGSIWRGCLNLPAFFHVAAELLASTGLGLCLGLVFPEASRGRTPDDRGNFRVPWAPKSTLGLGFPNKILMDWFLTRWCWTRLISVG